MLADVRVVLVRPHFAGNIGATARVMANFGLSQLVLVDPVANLNSHDARRLATHGEPILEQARIVPDLGTAIADCRIVLATSSHVAGLYRADAYGTPERILPQLFEDSPGAIVFGPEPSGLSNSEIARCHYLIQIPTDREYDSLNLAQSVAVCLYELRKLWQAHNRPRTERDRAAPHEMQERMFERLREGLIAIHFLYGEKTDALFHGLRHMIGRARPTEKEVRILFGLARQMKWIAAQQPGAATDTDDDALTDEP